MPGDRKAIEIGKIPVFVFERLEVRELSLVSRKEALGLVKDQVRHGVTLGQQPPNYAFQGLAQTIETINERR